MLYHQSWWRSYLLPKEVCMWGRYGVIYVLWVFRCFLLLPLFSSINWRGSGFRLKELIEIKEVNSVNKCNLNFYYYPKAHPPTKKQHLELLNDRRFQALLDTLRAIAWDSYYTPNPPAPNWASSAFSQDQKTTGGVLTHRPTVEGNPNKAEPPSTDNNYNNLKSWKQNAFYTTKGYLLDLRFKPHLHCIQTHPLNEQPTAPNRFTPVVSLVAIFSSFCPLPHQNSDNWKPIKATSTNAV